MSLPPLNALRVFEAVGRRGSVKQAAEELFVTPGAVSRVYTNLGVLDVVQGMSSAGALADMIASFLEVHNEEKQAILESFELSARLDRVLSALSARLDDG
jgi:ATP-dependent Lon protease